MEEMAFISPESSPVSSLKKLIATGTQMTPAMERRITRVFGISVFQTYGLNEIGIVAIRCEAGRYHENVEHCLVEIVDDDGNKTKVGEIGRIVVTTMNNYAMPLIRYDTGDMAQAVDDECACGRTLSSFGDIAGRLRRFAHLPPHTREKVNCLTEAIEQVPKEYLKNLRQYQVYQDKNNHFELRVRASDTLPDEFYIVLEQAWRRFDDNKSVLTITVVDEIEPSPSGKTLDFISDYYPKDETVPV